MVCYDREGHPRNLTTNLKGHSILAAPHGGFYISQNGEKPNESAKVLFLKNGKVERVDSGLKFATGLAYRPDQWLLSIADGHSKWVYSYQIADDGSLKHKERFFALHVADWDDDAGAESLCYSLEGRQFVATRSGIQISADDGPTQIILPTPEGARVTGVCFGGPDKDFLFAFCGDKIWKRKVQQHGIGVYSPWTKVTPNKL